MCSDTDRQTDRQKDKKRPRGVVLLQSLLLVIFPVTTDSNETTYFQMLNFATFKLKTFFLKLKAVISAKRWLLGLLIK